MPFTKRALYQAGVRSRNIVRAEFRRSDAYKAMQEIRDAVNTPARVTASADRFTDMLRQYGRYGFSAQTLKKAAGMPFGEMVGEVVRYSMSGSAEFRLISQMLGTLGPFGRLLSSFLDTPEKSRKKSGLEAEIDAALRLIQAFRPEALKPEFREPTKARSGEVFDSLAAAQQLLEEAGYVVTPPEQQRTSGVRPKGVEFDDPPTAEEEGAYPGGITPLTEKGSQRKQIDLEVEDKTRRFGVNHPIATKEMVTSFSSSNVFGYSYDYDTDTLYVRYIASDKYGGGPGSLYAYSNVTPEKFMRLMDAPSKGSWLWDNIRIRGTWSGHQHDYRLAAVRNDYVPRKATFVGNNQERFIPRTVRVMNKKTGRIRTLKSVYGNELAPALGPDGTPNRGRPNRGTPNRGTPNRGTPNRG